MIAAQVRGVLVLAGVVAMLGVSGCTRSGLDSGPSTTPTSVPTYAPPLEPSGRTVRRPEPIKDEFLLHNPLYRAGRIAAVTCSLPTAKLVDQRTMIRYATAFVACLDRAWAPVISRAGFDFVPPGAVHSSPTGSKTACGVMEEGTFGVYCDDDRGIYFNWPEYVVKESYRQEAGRASVQYLIAHEYGHHVQWLTGISDDYAVRYGVVPEAARQTEVNRSEMQAHCFAAAFFGANRASLRIRGERLDHYGHGGYDRSDPELSNFDRWLRQAFRAAGPGGCRTWAAPAKSVTGA